MSVTSKINPGSFAPRSRVRARAVLSRVARELRRGNVRYAIVGALVDSLNLVSSGVGRYLAPRMRCPCCGYGGSFIHLHNERRTAWNSACPSCDSRSRHRGLALFLPKLITTLQPSCRLLHVAPEAVLRRAVEPIVGVTYETTDLFLTDVTHPGENLEQLSFADGVYDVILCNHVLEHLEHDGAAVAELARVLSQDGVAVLTIPGNFTRRETVTFPDNSLNGHYRDYGMDVVELFRRSFTGVDVVDLHALDRSADGLRYGIRRGETAFVLSKRRGGMEATLR